MEINYSVLKNGVKLIQLAGRMDMKGVESIDLKFTAYASSEKAGVVVDLAQVSFLASIAIRLLLTNARALQARGGKLALLNPDPLVAQVLSTSGVDKMIPVFADLEVRLCACAGRNPGLNEPPSR